MNETFPRPKVLVSRCLGFAACRYDGQILNNSLIEQLQPHVEMIPVCPETDCGLGIPRAPIRHCQAEEGFVVYQPATGREVTAQLQATIDSILAAHPQIDGAILKRKSPSCGLFDTKIYQGSTNPSFSRRAEGFSVSRSC